jgi:hypothetical protein
VSTVQNIIDFADRKYPNSETDANKVSELNDIHTEIFVKIARLKNEYTYSEDTTAASQLIYELPTDCTVDNIIAIRVSKSTTIVTPEIEWSTDEWDTFEYAGLNDDITTGYYYGFSAETNVGEVVCGTYSLIKDGLPIATKGLTIRLFYYKKPTALSEESMSDIPELHEDYHSLLKYGLIQSLASQGHNPDVEIADYWQKKYDEFMGDVIKNLSDRYSKTPTQSNQCEEYW